MAISTQYTDRPVDWGLIPEHMREGVDFYITVGGPTGHFLTALFSNDLRETFDRADDINAAGIRDYMRFLYTYAPAGCWGSEANFQRWRKQGGLRGLRTEREPADAIDEHSEESDR